MKGCATMSKFTCRSLFTCINLVIGIFPAEVRKVFPILIKGEKVNTAYTIQSMAKLLS